MRMALGFYFGSWASAVNLACKVRWCTTLVLGCWASAHTAPGAICDVPLTSRTLLQAGDLQGALHAARMRPDSDILDALDQHYRLHWIVRQAQVQQQPAPAGLNADVLMERHHALNWLVRFEGNDWDDVDTPT